MRDDNAVVSQEATTLELRTNLIHFWTLEAYETTEPLRRDLVELGCTEVARFSLSPGAYGKCIPDVVVALAARASVLRLFWDGPIVVP